MICLPDEEVARRIPDAASAIHDHGADCAGLATKRDDRTLDHPARSDTDETVATDADKKSGIDAEIAAVLDGNAPGGTVFVRDAKVGVTPARDRNTAARRERKSSAAKFSDECFLPESDLCTIR